MLLKGYIVLTFFIVASCAKKWSKGGCEDGMFDLADGKYSCDMLIDKHHPHQHVVGAYDIRETICSRPNFGGCCKTCLENNLLTEPSTQPRRPVHIDIVINEDLPGTQTDPHEIDSCKDTRLEINGINYDCAMLIERNFTGQEFVKAYKNRKKLCNRPKQSGCCRTCTALGLYDGLGKPSSSEDQHEHEPPEYCQDSLLHVADGSYDCEMLINKDYRHQEIVGAFDNRKKLCSKPRFSGCCYTCQRHVIKKKRQGCKDEYVVVLRNKNVYACRELLYKYSDIYPDRFDLCADKINTRCCKTCAKLSKTKDTDGLLLNENMIKKPGVVEVFPSEGESNPSVTGKEASGFTAYDMSEAFRLMRTLIRKFNELMTSGRKLL